MNGETHIQEGKLKSSENGISEACASSSSSLLDKQTSSQDVKRTLSAETSSLEGLRLIDGVAKENENYDSVADSCFDPFKCSVVAANGQIPCDGDSESGNDDGLTDECIYTYKGDHSVDQQFHRPLEEAGPSGEEAAVTSRCSSPEMDFLEMDFDPGNGFEPDSEDSEHFNLNDDFGDLPLSKSSQGLRDEFDLNNLESQGFDSSHQALDDVCQPSTSSGITINGTESHFVNNLSSNKGEILVPEQINQPNGVESVSNDAIDSTCKLNCSSHSKSFNLLSTQVTVSDGNQSSLDLYSVSSKRDNSANPLLQDVNTETYMICKGKEMLLGEPNHLFSSGAVAIINALMCLSFPSFSMDLVRESIPVRQRSEISSIPEYLFSRSVDICTQDDIVRIVEMISGNQLFAKFFPMFPRREVALHRWLILWMKRGAVPIVTLRDGNIEGWHHQMIQGCNPQGIFVSSPVDGVSEGLLSSQLCSPSEILISREDVISRWHEKSNLRPLMVHPDHRWRKLNVLGQVANVIRESMCRRKSQIMTHYVKIPSACSSGITLIIKKESSSYEELLNLPQFPCTEQF